MKISLNNHTTWLALCLLPFTQTFIVDAWQPSSLHLTPHQPAAAAKASEGRCHLPLQRRLDERMITMKSKSFSIFSFRQSSTLLAKPQNQKADESKSVNVDELKIELERYLAVRKEAGADELAKKDVGRTVGGTKGNKILEYISGSPNKESTIESAANPFDYDELMKYGFRHLATPIMEAGGRFAMYELLGMEAPTVTSKPKPKSAPKLVIDRTGETDVARYSGLKMGQVLDDKEQALALERAKKKVESGGRLVAKLEEEDYVMPFADKRNVGPKQTPDWTPEKLDEWGKQQGKAMAWARKAREGAFVKDPLETLDFDGQQRAYSILTALLTSTAFGRSTPTFLVSTMHMMDSTSEVQALLSVLQVPAAALLLSSIGSSFFCASQAKEKNRSAFIWFAKGLLGGPLTIRVLQGANPLQTQGQTDAAE